MINTPYSASLLFILLFPCLLIGQNLSFQIRDADSNKPISDAFIFIQNSSKGTYTDLDGQALLDIGGLGSFNLVITHINYQNKTLSSGELVNGLNTIKLQQNAQDLGAVVIATKKKNARNRKRWMREFQRAFFGKSNRDIELLNPETIWFEVSDSLFEAKALDNLILRNKALGYRIQFALDHFSIDANEDVRYSGQVFFADIKDQLGRTKRITKQREKQYLQSKPLFFLALVNNLPLQLEKYEFGFTQVNENQLYHFSPLAYEDLEWKRGKFADTLLLNDFLTVFEKGQTLNKTTSFLRSASGRFIISPQGQLLNPEEVEESGYWADYRLATQLPIDYEGAIQLKPQSQSVPMLDSLLQYRYRRAPEKIYVHLNQSTFSNQEQLWFKAYLVDGIDHRPFTQSEVVYVDLISPQHDIIKTWLLHRSTGLAGDFQWTSNHEPGTYRIRAYTNYMRNSDPDFFFEYEIELKNYLEESPSLLIVDPVSNTLQADFFPEGGDLIANIPANVAFLLRDSSLAPMQAAGQVVDSNDKVIIHGKTNHLGLGLISFVPQVGQTYYFQCTKSGQNYRFPLPTVFPEGLSLHVNPIDEKFIYLKVTGSKEMSLENAYLIGHVRGATFLYTDQLEAGKTVQISKAEIPPGLLHFTLFDQANRPQAERLAFNDHGLQDEVLNVPDSVLTFRPNQNYTLPIQLDSSLWESSVDLSASITNSALLPFGNRQESIQSYLLLNSDLDMEIPQADLYIQNNSNTNRYYLDLMLQCLSWRRFSWRSLSAKKHQKDAFSAEKGYTISGYTTRKEDTTRVQTQVMINSLEEDLIYQQIQTDEKGVFEFPQIPFKDSTTFILQGRIGKEDKQSEGKISGNRLVDIHLLPLSRAPVRSPVRPLYKVLQDEGSVPNSTISLLKEKAVNDQQNNQADWTIELEQLDIAARRINPNNRITTRGSKFYNLDQTDWIAPEAQGVGILGSLAPAAMFQTDGNRLISITRDWQGRIVKTPVIIEINGISNKGTFNASRFLSLTADDIQSIYVGGAFISVRTRSIPRSREAYLDSGILQYEHPGYHQAREFSPSLYPGNASQDLRTSIQWIPKLSVDEKTGTAEITFTTLAKPSVLQLNVQGISSSGKTISFSQNIKWK